MSKRTYIDPLETMIKWLRAQAPLTAITGNRISERHEYGTAWKLAQPSVTVRIHYTYPDAYVPTVQVRMECFFYAKSLQDCQKMYWQLCDVARTTPRTPIVTSLGTALLYSILPETGASSGVDTDLDMRFIAAFFNATMSLYAVNKEI